MGEIEALRHLTHIRTHTGAHSAHATPRQAQILKFVKSEIKPLSFQNKALPL